MTQLQSGFQSSLVGRSYRSRTLGQREVSLTPNKRGSFGGYGIELDEHLATILGGHEGQKIAPSEMTKRLWQYIKRHNLGKKNSQ